MKPRATVKADIPEAQPINPIAIKKAHHRARPLLELTERDELRDLRVPTAGGVEIAVRSALRLLFEAGYVGPARTVLEWGGEDSGSWSVAAKLALRYLAADLDATDAFSPNSRDLMFARRAVDYVNARHRLTSFEPRGSQS